VSCNKPTEPDRESAAPPKATGAAAPTGAATKDLAWDASATWQKAENASPMRKATYKIPHAEGDAEDGEMSVTKAGGSVDQNVQRWAGQFAAKAEDVKRLERRSGGFKVTLVEMHGPYTAMSMPGTEAKGPKQAYALLGAIVETSPPTFFK